MKLTILPEDIEKGHRRSATTCPTAYACMRQFNLKNDCVTVGYYYITIWDNSDFSYVKYSTSHELEDEMDSFDRGQLFTPGEYEITEIERGML